MEHIPATIVNLAKSYKEGEDCAFALHDALLEAGFPQMAGVHFLSQDKLKPCPVWTAYEENNSKRKLHCDGLIAILSNNIVKLRYEEKKLASGIIIVSPNFNGRLCLWYRRKCPSCTSQHGDWTGLENNNGKVFFDYNKMKKVSNVILGHYREVFELKYLPRCRRYLYNEDVKPLSRALVLTPNFDTEFANRGMEELINFLRPDMNLINDMLGNKP